MGDERIIRKKGREYKHYRHVNKPAITTNAQSLPTVGKLWEPKSSLGSLEGSHNIQKTKIMASDLITSCLIDGEKVETVADLIFLGSKITANGDCSHEIRRHLLLRRKAMTNLDSMLTSRNITFLTKVCPVKAMVSSVSPSSQSYSFSSSHVWKWKLDHKESWVPKKWCFQNVMLEKTVESSLDSKEIKPVNPKETNPE